MGRPDGRGPERPGQRVGRGYWVRVGQRIGSAALVADGLHARTDGFTSLAVVLGAIGVMLGFPLADPIIGLVITVAILAVLRGAATDVFRRLMDAVDPTLIDRAEGVLGATPGVRAVDRVRMRWIGHTLHAEADLTVSDSVAASVALREAHDLAHRCELELRAGASPVSRARQRTLSTMRLHTTPTRSFVEPAG